MSAHAAPATRTSAPLPLWLRVLTVPAAALAALAGIWVAGGVLTDDFRLSMVLTALWFVAVAVAAAVTWRRLPALRPAAVAAVVAFVVAGAWLGLASVRDVEVNERLAAGPALATGTFRSHAHSTRGTARIVAGADGARLLALAGFRTDPGPDLYVYVVPGRADGTDVDGGTRVGRLKGNVGDQQYALPAALDVDDAATVVIWCRAFSVSFGSAPLSRT
jgi:hypothetical protein